MARILLAEEDPTASIRMSRAMRAKGWIVDVADHGRSAVELAGTGRYRLVILDLELASGEGLRLLRALMAVRPDQKVIVLIGPGTSAGGLQAHEYGAADYLVRPFSVDELLARILARLQDPSAGDTGWYLHCSGLTLDLARRTVDTGHDEHRLTQRECVLMAHLMSEESRVFSRQELRSEVGADTPDPGSRVVDVCVRRLRSKLGTTVIETVRNVGYTLRTP